MTLPPSLQDLETPSGNDPGLTRVSVLLDGLRLDVALPGDTEIGSYVGELLDIANAQLAADRVHTRFDTTGDRWTLATLGGVTLDVGATLSAAGVYDGDVLVMAPSSAPVVPILFDDVGAASVSPGSRWWSAHQVAVAAFAVAVAAALGWAWLMPRHFAGTAAAAATLAVGAVAAAAACLSSRGRHGQVTSVALSVLSVPLMFTGALTVIPNNVDSASLSMAFAVLALSAQLTLQISRTGHAWHTFVFVISALGGLTAASVNWWEPRERAVGAVLATVSVIVLYLAPRATIMMAKLPVPRVPTAGEPLDDIEMDGGTTVEGVGAVGLQVIPTEEGLLHRVRRANQYLTGILAAVAVTAVVGCHLAVDTSEGFYWQGSLFAVVTAAVLCLRGRSHHDLVQSATMIGAGLCIAIVSVVEVAASVHGWPIRSALVLVSLVVVALLCGLVAPRREFSPVMRRWVEILEWLAIGLVFPLCFWIVGLYAYMRGLRL
ncbi:type VII secretion integral membrane protein EccD [Mycobacterium sp. CPCC 205372]|uniref:Type VII secretion integral membrane protein EccD n=1 Tax=Mycobacterium hippophais TaxID=3016340 RepID=A0ABT4PUE7_9MYCO|nr:type VII secretion integral membrane protein EccD [Mycobacterium hippophais]MCZ8380186.1 type VII secretion integral membrane protein EccD [Mycobacterium hippophais]